MDLKELMNTTPETLAELQLAALKKHAIDILKGVVKLIENDEFKAVKELTIHSPAGDGYGQDNNYINFSYDKDARKYPKDIDELMDELEHLQKLRQVPKKGV